MIRAVMGVVVAVTVALGAGAAAAAEKAALVIGNAAYQNVTALANPVNDASDMAAALKRMGYSVTLVTNGDLSAMNDGLRSFLRDADRADSALIFYSGHGVQVKGRNYLIPVSARIGDELDLDTQAVAVDKVMDLLDGVGARVKIVILDSCRDNPLTKTLVRGGGTRGLARLDLDAASARGTYIAFSTAPGSVAQDGHGRNSPFTQALLAHIETPDLDIRTMFGQVRADVDTATQGGQLPWTNEAIIGSFALVGKVADAGTVKTITPVPQAEPQQAVQPPPIQPQPVQPQPVQPQPEPESQQALAVPIPDVPEPQAPARQRPAIREFVIPDSSVRRLTWDDLAGLSPAQLRVARNEIYARKGRIFKDAGLRAYFSQFSWYQPLYAEVQLNALEKANAALIQRAEAGN